MLPMMCIQPPCMNIALKMVSQFLPETMSAGMTDHWRTNDSPPMISSTKTSTFIRIIAVVIAGYRAGRREASVKGIIVMAVSRTYYTRAKAADDTDSADTSEPST